MSEQGRCKTCKWWGEPSSENHRECERLTGDMDAFDWDRYYADDMLNGSAGEYHVSTGPDFGCIHHEAKGDDK